MKVEWKIIKGYEGLYEISNTGLVKSLPKTWKSGRKYTNERTSKEKLMATRLDFNGYVITNLYKNKKMKTVKIHRLVAEAFISNPENKPQVNHIDSNKINNNVDNLEWCTQLENMAHANARGRMIGVRKHPLTKKEVLKIREIYPSKTQVQLAKDYNVSVHTINKLLNYRTWKHI